MRASLLYVLISQIFVATSYLVEGTKSMFGLIIGVMWLLGAMVMHRFEREELNLRHKHESVLRKLDREIAKERDDRIIEAIKSIKNDKD